MLNCLISLKIKKIKFTHKLKSLDGADFRIPEPSPFSPKWYSHKFNGAALRYEIALEVESGCIVWAYGGFPAGMRDIDIAKRKFIKQLKKGEKAVADKGYRFCKRFSCLKPTTI